MGHRTIGTAWRRALFAAASVLHLAFDPAFANEVIVPTTVQLVQMSDLIVVGRAEAQEGLAVVVEARDYVFGSGPRRFSAENPGRGFLGYQGKLQTNEQGVLFLSRTDGVLRGEGFASLSALPFVRAMVALRRDPGPFLMHPRWQRDPAVVESLGYLFDGPDIEVPDVPGLGGALTWQLWRPWHVRERRVATLHVHHDERPRVLGDGTALGEALALQLTGANLRRLPNELRVVVDTRRPADVGTVGYGRAVQYLVRVLREPRLVEASANALIRLRAHEAIPDVIEAFRNATDAQSRTALVRVLAAARDRRATVALSAALVDEWSMTGVSATTSVLRDALICLGDQRALPALRKAGNNDEALAVLGTDEDVDALTSWYASRPGGWWNMKIAHRRTGLAAEPWMEPVPMPRGASARWREWWLQHRDRVRIGQPLAPEDALGLFSDFVTCSGRRYFG